MCMQVQEGPPSSFPCSQFVFPSLSHRSRSRSHVCSRLCLLSVLLQCVGVCCIAVCCPFHNPPPSLFAVLWLSLDLNACISYLRVNTHVKLLFLAHVCICKVKCEHACTCLRVYGMNLWECIIAYAPVYISVGM